MAAPPPDLAVVEQALRVLAPDGPVLLTGEDADALAAQAQAAPDGAVVGALGVLDLLDHVAPLLDALRAAAARGATVVLSVPNTPYTGVGRAWGAGAVEELRALLPAGHRELRVVPVAGAALVGADEEAEFSLDLRVDGTAVPSTAVLAFGPRAAELAAGVRVAAADLAAERAERRRLQADNAFLLARVADLERAPGTAAG
jgi:hypothetical protein